MRPYTALLLIVGLAGCPAKDDKTPTDTDLTDGTDTTDPVTDEEPTDTDEPLPPEFWEWCPARLREAGDGAAEDIFVGAMLRVTEDALWCAMSSESQTLEQAAEKRVQLRLMPGAYELPFIDNVESQAFDLPTCARVWGDGPHPTADGEGTLTYSRQVSFGYDSATWNATLPLSADGDAWTLSMYIAAEAEGSLPQTLFVDVDAEDRSDDFGVPRAIFELVEGSDPTNWEALRSMAPCAFEGDNLQTTQITFENGHIDLDLRIGESMASTEPAMFTAARGSYAGVDFEITDYFSLVYRPDHHHFGRHFAVWFAEPQGDVCGLRIEDVDPFYAPGAGTPARVREMGCDMTPLAELSVNTQATVR